MSTDRCQRIQKEMKKFSYKVGSRVGVEEMLPGIYRFEMNVPARHNADTRRPTRDDVVWMTAVSEANLFHANGKVNVAALKGTVLNLARGVEMHEIDEWLRFNNKPLHSPHFT